MPENQQTYSHLLREAAHQFLAPLGVRQKDARELGSTTMSGGFVLLNFSRAAGAVVVILTLAACGFGKRQLTLALTRATGVKISWHLRTDQFETAAKKLVKRAAAEVERYRSLFATVSDVAAYYMKRIPTPTPREFWPNFHAAVACGAVGRRSDSRRYFDQVLRNREDLDWIKAAQTEAAALISVLDDTDMFRQIVLEKVIRTRELLKLPKQETANFASWRCE
jgi:hypothetical protein